MNKLVTLNGQLVQISSSTSPAWLKNLKKAAIFQQFAWELAALYFGKSIRAGIFDAQPKTQLVY